MTVVNLGLGPFRRQRPGLRWVTVVVVCLAANAGRALAQTSRPDMRPAKLSAQLEAAIKLAGGNAVQLRLALEKVPPAEREGMEFLIANMPPRDLTSLSTEFLLENVHYAYKVMAETPWGAKIPHEIFLNDILPYASLNERRDNWRKDFYTRFLPLIKDCKTPTHAAGVINTKAFGMLKVGFSKARKKPDQSPYESVESGKATCTGLAILLVDACRAVGVPARFVGTPVWTDDSGNHSWVEVWDDGWHFTGAAEATGDVLDIAWFVGRASAAKRDKPMHAIYAASFRRTGLRFPLIWALNVDYVSAVNVTDRYTQPKKDLPKDGQTGAADLCGAETSRSSRLVLTSEERKFLATPAGKELAALLKQYFDAAPDARDKVAFPPAMDALLARHGQVVRKLAWRAYIGGWTREQYAAELKAREVKWENYTSPYTVRAVGAKPANGWPLFIAMHGGGGAPKDVNDQQWRVMQTYYRDHAEKGGYLYAAIRAPTDAWNGFYAGYNLHLTERLIRQWLLSADVDSDRVYLMGYSHGGYGAFFQGLAMADHFAAIHASAAAPTDWNEQPKNLRNTVFTFMIGTDDHAYGRFNRCKSFDEYVRKLRGDRKDIYPVTMEVRNSGHTGLPDRDKIADLYPHVRTPVPKHVFWSIYGPTGCFNWLYVPKMAGGSVEAVSEGNTITVTADKVAEMHLLLDERLIDYAKPVTVVANGAKSEHRLKPSLKTLCETLQGRGDFQYMFSSRIALALPVPKEENKK